MKKSDKAVEYFRNKFNCSQSVFTVFSPDYGFSENDSLKVSCAFGGGMGRQQLTCGAVTGALMTIGLKYGKGINDAEEMKQLTYLKTREFFAEFTKIHGSTNCRELLDGLDMTDPEDHEKIIERKLFDIKCEEYVASAVRITERILND
jgi:C_GCAxxG_C_C family probable redox protein